MINKKISIIIPVYNAEKFIHKCLESIANQTYKDYEIILINDGSKDKTGEICDSFKDTDPRIKVYHTQNNGQAIARNYGMKVASGEYITFVDGDDWLSDDALETMIDHALRNDYDIVSGCFYRVNSKTSIQKSNYSEGIVDKHGNDDQKKRYEKFKVSAYFGYACGKLYKTSFIRKNNIGFENSKKFLMEDALFNLIAISYNPKYFVFNKPIYYYYIREQSTSNSSAELTDKALNLIQQYTMFLNSRDIYQESHNLLSPLLGRVFCWTLFNEMSLPHKTFKELLGEIKRFMEYPTVSRIVNSKEAYSGLDRIPLLQKMLYSFCFFAGSRKLYRLIGCLFAISYPLFKIYVNVFVRR